MILVDFAIEKKNLASAPRPHDVVQIAVGIDVRPLSHYDKGTLQNPNAGSDKLWGVKMNIVLWILQIFLGSIFMGMGVLHFTLPADLPDMLTWMYALPTWLHVFSGSAEILGALGLILPGVFRIQTHLTPLAGAGLVLVMLGAAVFQLSRGAFPNMVANLFLAALAGFIAYRRWKINPISDRAAMGTT